MIIFKTLFCIVRHLDSITSYLFTGFHLGFFRSWPSLYLPSRFSSVFLGLGYLCTLKVNQCHSVQFRMSYFSKVSDAECSSTVLYMLIYYCMCIWKCHQDPREFIRTWRNMIIMLFPRQLKTLEDLWSI
jgi:hypothetical protein